MGMRKAINDKCKECSFDPSDKGTWRYQVGLCTYTECGLHPYRPKPYKKASKTELT